MTGFPQLLNVKKSMVNEKLNNFLPQKCPQKIYLNGISWDKRELSVYLVDNGLIFA